MSLTSSAPAATSTNAIPNLHGGAHPATPHLAGIVCGSCLLFAWTVCLIYWYFNRRREGREERAETEKELEARETLEIPPPAPPIRRARTRSASPHNRRKYPPGTQVLGDKKKSSEEVAANPNPIAIVTDKKPAGDPPRSSLHPPPPSGYMTPMAEVPTRDERGRKKSNDRSLPATRS